MKKCKQCGQKDGTHKMSCESRKIFIIEPKFENKDDAKQLGLGDESIFIMLNDIVNGKFNKK